MPLNIELLMVPCHFSCSVPGMTCNDSVTHKSKAGYKLLPLLLPSGHTIPVCLYSNLSLSLIYNAQKSLITSACMSFFRSLTSHLNLMKIFRYWVSDEGLYVTHTQPDHFQCRTILAHVSPSCLPVHDRRHALSSCWISHSCPSS